MSVRKLLFGDQHNPYDNMKTILPFRNLGWGSHSKTFAHVIEKIKPKLIVEVGSWFGVSARHMAKLALQYNPDVEVVCIDTFLGSVEQWVHDGGFQMDFENGRPTIYNQFLSNAIHEGATKYITPFPIDSINGYHFFKRLDIVPDLVYIDAGHDYISVKQDLLCWTERVRKGGVIIGDDYISGTPVAKAVDEVCGKVEPMDNKFIWYKT